jgi:hypothetical protein
VRSQVLKRGEALADGPHLLGREVSAFTIEAGDGLPHAEVAGGPRFGTPEVPREEPVRSPFADSRQGRQLCFHVLIRKRRKLDEIEVTACQADDVIRLAPREAERGIPFEPFFDFNDLSRALANGIATPPS